MRLQPGKILLDPRGIHDQEKFFGFDAVNDQVIDHTRLLVKQKSVLPGADLELGEIVGQHGV